jgi:hypothetical protein
MAVSTQLMKFTFTIKQGKITNTVWQSIAGVH